MGLYILTTGNFQNWQPMEHHIQSEKYSSLSLIVIQIKYTYNMNSER
jgi:hypothetical protein